MLIGTINSSLASARAFATKTIQKLLILSFAASLTTLGLPAEVFAAVPTAPDLTFKLLAAGERTSVLAPTGSNVTTNHNGSEWYYNTNQSIGFANAGSTITQSSADTSNYSDPLRLSWHAVGGTTLNPGWRAGEVTGLNSSTEYRRYIYEASTLPAYYPSGPQTLVPVSDLTGWTLCYTDYYADTALFSNIWAACDGDYLLYAASTDVVNLIDVKKNGSSVLDTVGGSQSGSANVYSSDTLNLSLLEPNGTTPITWSDFRIYVSNCNAVSCEGTNPITNAADWDAGTVVTSGSYTVPVEAQGKYLAIFVADDETGEAVNANWIKLVVKRTPVEYEISSCEQLMAIGTTGYPTDIYKLANDIDCSGIDFEPIAWDSEVHGNDNFTGIFDGRNYTISNLTINRPDGSDIGLFNEAQDGAVINNIVFKDSVIKGRSDTGTLVGEADEVSISNVKVINGLVEGTAGDCSSDIGGIVGEIDDDVGTYLVERVYFNGVISAGDCDDVGGIFGDSDGVTISSAGADVVLTAEDDAGGLIGEAQDTEILESYSTGSIIISGELAGGIAGRHSSSTTRRSYSNASVEGYTRVGGLVGANGGTIEDSYATGDVEGDNNVGGLAGRCGGSIENSYSIGKVTGVNTELTGGFLGSNEGCGDTSNFWDSEASGTSDSNAGTAKTTTEMKQLSTFTEAGWDFEEIWLISTDFNNGYPCLAWDSRVCVGDGDNISSEIENFAPNGGDANNDGTIDSEQSHVTGYVNAVGSKYVAIETNDDCSISEVGSSEESTSIKDSGYDYEQGLLNFEADCGTPGYTTTVKMFFYGVSKANLVARKFKPANNSYFNVPGATITETTVDNRVVTMVEYSIKDGGELDLDGAENGVIIDPVGLGKIDVGAPNTGLGGLYSLVKMIR